MSDGEGQPGSQGEGEVQKIKVGEKEYTPSDVENLLSDVSKAAQKQEQLSGVLATCEKYGITPEDFVQNAEGAFAALNSLIKEGVVDEHGNPKAKEPPKKEEKSDEGGLDKDLDEGGGKKPPGKDAAVMKALDGIKGDLDKRLAGIEETQTGLIKQNFQDRLMRKHDGLTLDDTEAIFATAMNDRTKTLWQHAEDYMGGKKLKDAELRKKYATEFGVNLEEFDANKLDEADGKGGAAIIAEGKKFSFKKKGDKFVSPLKASQEYMDRLSRGG